MLPIDERFLVVVIALAADAAIGEPGIPWSRLPHPVVLMGRAVDWLDARFNDAAAPAATRRQNGVLALAGLVLAALALGWLLAAIFAALPFGLWLEAILVAVLLAGRSLYDHVVAVAKALARDGLDGGRQAVRHIVGRDPGSLDRHGVARAAIESAAENFSDGVVAPVFWYALLGLPGLIAYKAINTADSMIGHRTLRHEDFGWAAARVDDGANYLPARLSGLLIALAALVAFEDGRAALRAMREDARHHRSVNAGWPEAAMAGALGLALAGPRRYGDIRVDDAWMNREGRDDAEVADIERALTLLVVALILLGALYALCAVLA